jgi:hypothetical protein
VYHVADSSEVGVLIVRVSWCLFISSFLWLLYVALEPLVRRRWPTTLVSWSRVLAGQFRDPLVGRDVLLGAAAATLIFSAQLVWLPVYWGGKFLDHPWNLPQDYTFLIGMRFELGTIAGTLIGDIFFSLGFLFVLFLVRLLLRRDWLVVLAIAIVFPCHRLGAVQLFAGLHGGWFLGMADHRVCGSPLRAAGYGGHGFCQRCERTAADSRPGVVVFQRGCGRDVGPSWAYRLRVLHFARRQVSFQRVEAGGRITSEHKTLAMQAKT